jgi:tripartite ATP-independent transporter DctP family solute receptor
MKSTRLLVVLMVFTLMLILSGEGIAGDTVTLKMATVYSATHPNSIAANRAAQLINRRSNGEIILEYYPAGQLGGNNEITEGLITGSIDMSIGGAHNIAEHYSEIGITVGPYIFRDFEHAYNVIEGEIGEYLNKNLIEKAGIRFLSTWKYGKRHITTKGIPVYKPEDLKGVKLRASDDEIGLATVTALGASPTPMAFPELYLGLQLGTVDGQENPISTIVTSNFQEVQDYLILTGHTINTVFILMSEISWNKLNEEQQGIIQTAFRETKELNDYLIDEIDKSGLKIWEESGGTIIEPDIEAFREASKVVYSTTFKDRWGEELYERIQAVK